jgi:hypothetical protein
MIFFNRDGQVVHANGVLLGHIVADVDGFYYFWPKLRGGHWSQELLRTIADHLEIKNKPWQDQIDQDQKLRA